MPPRRSFWAAFAAVSLASTPLLARPAYATAQDAAVLAVGRLSLGQTVRVEAPGVAVEEGRVTELDAQMFVVASEGQEWVIQARDLEELAVRRRDPVPSTLGFAAVGLLGGFVVDKMLTQVNPDAAGSHILLAGAGVGGGIGLLIGLNKWRWRVVYPN